MAAFDLFTSPYHIGEPVPVPLTEHPHEQVQTVAAASRDPVAVVCEAVAQTVTASAESGHIPLLFAGDCLAPLGVVAGLQRAGITEPAVVWFDGHGDFNTPETSPSGYLPGMALAMLVGRGHRGLAERLDMQPIDERHVLLVDARDLDPAEAEALAASQVTHAEVGGVAAAVPGASSVPIYVHVDADVVDPVDMPGMGFPAAGGPSLAAVAEALAALSATGRLCAVSFGTTFRADGRDAGAAVAATDRLATALV